MYDKQSAYYAYQASNSSLTAKAYMCSIKDDHLAGGTACSSSLDNSYMMVTEGDLCQYTENMRNANADFMLLPLAKCQAMGSGWGSEVLSLKTNIK